MKQLFLLLFCISTQMLFGQTVNYSLPEKIAHKNYDYAILGKTTEGILIYKYNRYENILACYDEVMNKKWERSAQLNNRGSAIQHISIKKNDLIVFFSFDKGNSTLMGGQIFSNKMEAKTKFVQLDSVFHEKWTSPIDWYVMHDEAHHYYYIYYYTYPNSTSTAIHGILVDENLKLIKTTNIQLPVSSGAIIDELIDNAGNVWFISGESGDKGSSTKTFWTNVVAYKLSLASANNEQGIVLTNHSFGSILTKIDNINNQLVVAGIYTSNGANLAGFGIVKLNLGTDSIVVSQFEPFTENQLKEMRQNVDADVNNFEISDLVLRFDGGLILFAENTYNTVQTVEVPNYYSPSFPTIKTYTYEHFDDVMVNCFTAEGRLNWQELLRKKQVSENDEGYYSSYGLVKGKDKLSVIYNEEISDQTNLMAYMIKQDGTLNRGSVCNSKQKNIFLSPRKARQVSLYEMVIPSEYRGYLQFVKIDF